MIETAHRLDPDDPDVRREWLNTLPREQRAKELQEYLSGDTDDDAKDRAHLTHMLTLLQQEAGQPHRGCRQVNSVTLRRLLSNLFGTLRVIFVAMA